MKAKWHEVNFRKAGLSVSVSPQLPSAQNNPHASVAYFGVAYAASLQ